ARKAVAQLGFDVKHNQVTAPFEGVVAAVKLASGDVVEPMGPICELVDDRTQRARAPFAESDVERLAVGMSARVSVAGQTAAGGGSIERIDAIARGEGSTRTVLVDVAIPREVKLRTGTSASIDVTLDRKAGVLVVPTSAIVADHDKKSVMVVASDGIVRH